jgi:amino acid adenylation domain-containing protein
MESQPRTMPIPANAIQDTYPLSPMQQGLLFQSLYASRPGVDIEQVLLTLPEAVDAPALKRAWARVLERHDILRTGFRWERLPRPVQEVHRKARLAWTQQDWRRLSPAETHQQLESSLNEDRRKGFDLSLPPLMRLAVFRTGPAEHQLIWTFHHLLLDSRSMVVLLKEVFALYEAFRQGGDLELPPPRPCRDHFLWLQRRDWRTDEPFWREQLKGFRVSTPLPFAGTPPADRAESVPGEQSLTLSEELTAACENMARQSDATPGTVVQGAWALLLGRHGDVDDVVFGAVRACRHAPVEGAAGLIGLLINTVPLRVRLTPDRPVRAWLRDLRQSWVALRPHEHTPLTEIQNWSEVPHGTPLFQTLLNYQDPGWDTALQAQGGPWSRRKLGKRSLPGYPLALDACGGQFLRLKLIYDRTRFDDAAIARMLGHLKALIEGMVADPGRSLAQLPLLTAEERREILGDWNGTRADFPADQTACDHFERQAALTPESPALVTAARTVTYAELNEHAGRIAGRLRELWAGPGARIAVLAERGPDMVAGLLAVWKVGAAYIPLDPEYPSERLAFMLHDAAVPVVLTQRKLAPRLPPTGSVIVCLDEPLAAAGAVSPSVAGPDDIAYVIYTSGSTGQPKGVAVTHRSLGNLVAWHRQTYRVTPADRATQLASPAFDAAVWELWPYLSAGASVHVPDDETRLAPPKLVSWLAEHRITLCFLPTPLLEAALAEPWPENMALRAVLTGGDTLHRRPGKNFPGVLVNHYGPTECTVVATTATIEPGGASGTAPPIGRPIANTEVFVLDRHLHPVPVGVAGLAHGYLNRPDLTAEKFVPHPFQPDARLYQTGDRARWRPDGQLEFLGRLDDQVKILGHRVELGEIEAALAGHPAVRQGAVVAQETAHGGRRLVAFCVPAADPPPAEAELRLFLRSRLPEAMVPAAFVVLAALPLTPHGKVDRRALAALEPPGTARPAADPPRTPVEQTLAAIWGEVLGQKDVGRTDNFFELGGHSLFATQAIMRARTAFGIDLPVRALFDHATVADMADLIEAGRRPGFLAPSEPFGSDQPDALIPAASHA